MPPSQSSRAHSAGVALPLTLTSWHGAFGPGWRRETEIQTARQRNTNTQTKGQQQVKYRLTLASIRKPVKLLRICSILSPESSTDSASSRWRSPSTLNHCCICRDRSCKAILMLLIFLLLCIESQHLIYYQG